MPVSLAVALVAPLVLAWVQQDDWWWSPIFWGTLVTAPMKWVPWAETCLVWPGLM